MIQESNLCFADVTALFSTVRKKEDTQTSKEHKTGQFIVLKQ